MRTALTLALASSLAFATAGCEKAHKSSGPLGGDDLAMLRDLPGGNVALIGGNYMKMQNFMQSSLGQLAENAMDKAGAGKGFKEWMTCFSDMKSLRVAGGVAMHDGLEVRLAFRGTSIDQIDGCAKQAGFTHTIDADKKFVEIEVPGAFGQTYSQGYLALADGTIYNRQRVQISLVPNIDPASREDLERDEKNLSTSNATDDKALLALAAKANRNRTMWFAGSGAHTPAADKIGDVYGSLDIDGGIAADITVGFAEKDMAKQVEDGLDQAKKMGDSLPPQVRSLIEGIKLDRDGSTVHVVAKLTDAQIKSLTKLGGLGGGID